MKRLIRRAAEFDMGSTAFFRLVALVAGLVANLTAIAILTRGYGAGEYAAYALLASLINLLPFADLGLGASLVNSTSDYAGGRLDLLTYQRHVSRVRDILLLVATSIVTIDVWLYLSGSWSVLLGAVGDSAGVAEGATFTILCVAAALPLGIGARVLQGRSRMSLVVRIGVVGPLLQLTIVLLGFAFDAPVLWYFVAPGLGYLVIAGLCTTFALRKSGVRLLPVFRALGKGGPADVRIATTALPFLVISVGMAAGFQSHRILLANLGSPAEVASYSIVAQFAGPLVAVLSVVGQNLWNRYRSDISNGTLTFRLFGSHLLIFAVVGIGASLFIPLVVPAAAGILSGDSVEAPLGLCIAASLYVFGVAVHQPSAMLLTDQRGLTAQAVLVVLGAIVNVVVLVAFVASWGATAAYVGAALSILAVQAGPSLMIAVRRIGRSTGGSAAGEAIA